MILEILNRLLCGIAAMEMQRDELEELVFIFHVVFEDLQTFIVKNVQFRLEVPLV